MKISKENWIIIIITELTLCPSRKNLPKALNTKKIKGDLLSKLVPVCQKEKKCVFNFFLNESAVVHERISRGRVFQIVGPAKLMLCSHFFDLIQGIFKRRGSIRDRRE